LRCRSVVKRLAAVLAFASLVLPATAEAKGMVTIRVCGADACVELEDRAAYVLSPAETVPEPPPLASFYRVDIEFRAGGDRNGYSVLFVPSSGLIASNVGAARALLWYVPRTEALEQLAPAIRELDAFGAPTAWPAAVESPPASSPNGRGWLHYLLAAGGILAILAAPALVRRIRPAQPRTA
jgi:hypothetical protein